MSRQRNSTKYVELNPAFCKACWKCVIVCKKSIIKKVNLIFHKHARLTNIDNCSGCLKCIMTCEFGAISRITNVAAANLQLS